MKLVIDCRENIFRPYFKEDVFKNLDIGDIQYLDDDNNIKLIIERKTIDDLKQSILDNRWREQKERLLSAVPSNRIIYLIEGNIMKKTTIKGGSNTLQGALINKMLRDNIFVYKTKNVDESVSFINKMLNKLEKDYDKIFNIDDTEQKETKEYSSIIKIKKKDNYTPELWYKQILLSIPQVSQKISDCIISNYPTLKSLIENVSDEKVLKDLSFETSTGKTRKIGPKLSQKIYLYLHKE